MLDAARVDGAGKLVCFLRVTLPNLKGSMYTILVVSLLNSFKIFREVYLVGGAYPQEGIYMLQHIFNNWYTNLDFDKMAAGAVLPAAALGGMHLNGVDGIDQGDLRVTGKECIDKYKMAGTFQNRRETAFREACNG